ncbi:hypothetical protein HAX54_048659, partial [Datura stramonium]|nr:hypothetical protein [Datura stramonium]
MFVMKVDYPAEKRLEDASNSETPVPTKEWVTKENNPSVISLCAVSGLEGSQTIYVISYNERIPLQILLDGGSTYNFINVNYVKMFGCKMLNTKRGYVSLDNN